MRTIGAKTPRLTAVTFGVTTVAAAAFLVLASGSATPVRAQQAVTPAAPAAPQPATPAPAQPGAASVTPSTKILPTYRIQREDVLNVSVLDHPELSVGMGGAPVLPDGTISLIYVGTIKVLDLTLSDVQKIIVGKLSRYYVRPQVTVGLVSRTVRTINILGTGAKAPGKMAIRDGWRLLDVLAASGAPTDRFELYKVQLIRPSENQWIDVDLERVYANDPAANVEMQVDDILRIDMKPEKEMQVIVSGAISKPGPITLPRNGSLVQLMAEVGPPLSNALISRVTIDRNGQTTYVDLRPYYLTGVEPVGVKLEAGDRIVVPENKDYFTMIGAVGKAGLNVIPDDHPLTVAKALLESALPVQQAEWKKTSLIRTVDGKTTTQTLDVETMVKSGDFTKDIPLLPGDYVYVPYKRGRKQDRALGDLGTVANLGGALWGFSNLFRVF